MERYGNYRRDEALVNVSSLMDNPTDFATIAWAEYGAARYEAEDANDNLSFSNHYVGSAFTASEDAWDTYELTTARN